MTEETFRKAISLNNKQKPILGKIRQALGITDPGFRPISLIYDEDTKVLSVISSSGKTISVIMRSVYVEFCKIDKDMNIIKYGQHTDVESPASGIEWLEKQIESLNKIYEEVEKL